MQSTSVCYPVADRLWVYQKDGSSDWKVTQTLEPFGKVNAGGFGEAVATSGELLAIGAPDACIFEGKNFSGAVYLFKREPNGEFVEHQRLLPKDAHFAQHFGNSIAMNGSILVVGF